MPADTLPLNPPPPYHATDTNPTWPPTTLVLAGQSIHASTATAPSPPLYRLNRGIASLTHATAAVELTRVERTVLLTKGGREPTVRARPRDIYTLKHTRTRTAALTGGRLPAADSPRYYIEAVSRRRRGTVFGDLGCSSFGVPRFVEDGRQPPVFEIRQRRRRDGTY
ncbi:hypothetical protein C8A01DRAFT_35065 [Parachaetomium inaequale]|uniref:Uncharacterized protein n=1 Tax=Parachaetomium inaequale TaxID=2588326 RepID=A0AAN6PH57_9PEZI|nr:hypothetical protein C8A01DRAFT_35065 [Parachaetomium inaequale]